MNRYLFPEAAQPLTKRRLRRLDRGDFAVDQSVLVQRRDPDEYPEITFLQQQYDKMQLYREWHLGRRMKARSPYPTGMPGMILNADASNLALVLNYLDNIPAVRRVLLEKLKEFNSNFSRVSHKVVMGSIQFYLEENIPRDSADAVPIPATRLSDGTMRYLCLLAVLCHPDPPPLTCIEEPEMGLHPDILPSVAELLVEASSRTQLIVTTHSDILVGALTETPEAVVVCGKENGQTQMRRLGREDLEGWLENYHLGDAWLDGKLGGVRW